MLYRKRQQPAVTTPGCSHQPACPTAYSAGRGAARLAESHPEQGWNLLCNGVILFEDTGELLPDGKAVAPHRPVPFQIGVTS
ncbi:DUF5999 family protein [Streptomyces sp. NPDC055025]